MRAAGTIALKLTNGINIPGIVDDDEDPTATDQAADEAPRHVEMFEVAQVSSVRAHGLCPLREDGRRFASWSEISPQNAVPEVLQYSWLVSECRCERRLAHAWKPFDRNRSTFGGKQLAYRLSQELVATDEAQRPGWYVEVNGETVDDVDNVADVGEGVTELDAAVGADPLEDDRLSVRGGAWEAGFSQRR